MPVGVALENDSVAVENEQASRHRLGKVGFGVECLSQIVEFFGEGVVAALKLEGFATPLDCAGGEEFVHVLEIVDDAFLVEKMGDLPELEKFVSVKKRRCEKQGDEYSEPAKDPSHTSHLRWKSTFL